MSRRESIWSVAALANLVACLVSHGAERQETGDLPGGPQSDRRLDGSIAFFERRIRPVLVEVCYRCHSQQAGKSDGGLQLDTREGVRRGGLKGPIITAGEPLQSRLIQVLREGHTEARMPMKGILPGSIISDFESWVRQGAPDPRSGAAVSPPTKITGEHWSFRPITKPLVPAVLQTSWVRDPVDKFVLSSYEKKGLQPGAPLDRASLLRRVSFDLTGLPPTIQELDSFLGDSSPTAFATVVDRLLNSPRFGEHWGRMWLAQMHYADLGGTGPEAISEDAWRYRDYVMGAFKEDKPYDVFIQEQLAGDLMTTDDKTLGRQRLIATGFLVVGNPFVFEPKQSRWLLDVADEQVDVTSRMLLGLTVSCARCHDHKTDPISMQDYYGLAGIFTSTATLSDPGDDNRRVPGEIQESSLATPEQQRELQEFEVRFNELRDRLREARETRMEFPGDVDSSKLSGVVVDNLAAEIQGAWKESSYSTNFVDRNYLHDGDANKGQKSARFVPDLPKDGLFEVLVSYTPRANRATNVPVTIHCQDGIKKVFVDQTITPTIDKVFVSLGRFPFAAGTNGSVVISNEGTKGFVVVDAVRFVEKRESETNAGPAATDPELALLNYHQLEKELLDMQGKRPVLPKAMAVKEGKIHDARIHVRGDPNVQGEEVRRGFLKVLGTPDSTLYAITDEGSGRLELAYWITNPRNPLTARVAVNRVWKGLFGRALAEPVDDLGVAGGRPDQPALLDYLAWRFMELGWSFKKLIREIVLSSAYQMRDGDSLNAAAGNTTDLIRPANRRLEPEVIRDAMLAAGGQLDDTWGGNWKPADADADTAEVARNIQAISKRRSVYLPVARSARAPVLEELANIGSSLEDKKDRAGETLSVGSRLIERCAHACADLLLRTADKDDSRRITLAYRQVLGRAPTSEETAKATQILKAVPVSAPGSEIPSKSPELARWEDLFQALLTSKEFARMP